MPATSPATAARFAGAGLLVATLALASPALAQERPPVPPIRDYAATYQVEAQGAGANQMRMIYNAQLQRVRMEMGSGQVGIIDHRARRMTMLMTAQRMAMEMDLSQVPSSDPQSMMRDAQFTRQGQDTVAGHRCIIYRVRSHGGESTSCVTGDGILLRSEGNQNGRPWKMEASELTLATQPANQFEVPAGFQRMNVPGGGGMPGRPQR